MNWAVSTVQAVTVGPGVNAAHASAFQGKKGRLHVPVSSFLVSTCPYPGFYGMGWRFRQLKSGLSPLFKTHQSIVTFQCTG